MGIVIPQNEIFYEASRSSGPGGQHVQKTSTRVTIRWNVLQSAVIDHEQKTMILEKLAGRITKSHELIIHVETHRSQLRNKQLAYKLLHDLVHAAIKKAKKRKRTKPSKKSIEKRLHQKNKTSEKKQLRKKISTEKNI